MRLLKSILLLVTMCSVSSRFVDNENYIVDKKESIVAWKGSMVFASKGQHTGYVSLSNGRLTFEKSRLTGGSVEIDMNTIVDEHHESDNDLIEHLKSPDFFDVKKFPTTAFAITQVTSAGEGRAKITGKLTIKGITQEVTFPAKIEAHNNVITAAGKITIDRTKWNVRYKSDKFFANLADEAISDTIEFDAMIVAKK